MVTRPNFNKSKTFISFFSLQVWALSFSYPETPIRANIKRSID